MKKKLELKKEIVAQLDDDKMNDLKGGAADSVKSVCPELPCFLSENGTGVCL